jgi:hypothetical protein
MPGVCRAFWVLLPGVVLIFPCRQHTSARAWAHRERTHTMLKRNAGTSDGRDGPLAEKLEAIIEQMRCVAYHAFC